MNYTSIEQSKKLVELGLNPKSADMAYQNDNWGHFFNTPFIKSNDSIARDIDLPCWSLAALRKLLPVGIKLDENTTYLFSNHNRIGGTWVYMYAIDDTSYIQHTGSDMTACYEMVVWLLENGYIDTSL